MGFLDRFLGARKDSTAADSLRDLLFGDVPVDRWTGGSEFAEARARLAAGDVEGAVAAWREIASNDGSASRDRLQAWRFLRDRGHAPPVQIAKRVLGVVLEVGLDEGLDVLAAYDDHTARYLNHAGGVTVWEAAGSSLDGAIDELLAASRVVVDRIGPWEGPRRGPPPRRAVRLSFLTPSGLHFGEGPFDALASDALAGRVVRCGTTLLQKLVAKVRPRSA